MKRIKYPIGIQTFSEIREEGYVYVDKTDLVYNLTQDCKYCFLSRPRRFGKSLLLSTLEAYFSGRRDLFSGLAMEKLETEWTTYPILHFDLNAGTYGSVEELRESLCNQLGQYELIYGANPFSSTPAARFGWLIEAAYKATGKKVVVLVDEYEKPVLQAIGNESLQDAFRDELKAFYVNLKSCDRFLRFAMLTGISRLGKMSIFSDLNNMEDISMRDEYAAICGITKQEIERYLSEELKVAAEKEGISMENLIENLTKAYDGYRFTKQKTLLFNPFSVMNALKNREIEDYWFETGTPTLLVKMLKNTNYNLWNLDGSTRSLSDLKGINSLDSDPVAILYQTGFLTIKEYNKEMQLFVLGYPNEEVKRSFLGYLLPAYTNQ